MAHLYNNGKHLRDNRQDSGDQYEYTTYLIFGTFFILLVLSRTDSTGYVTRARFWLAQGHMRGKTSYSPLQSGFDLISSPGRAVEPVLGSKTVEAL